jgi:hypothetical protein
LILSQLINSLGHKKYLVLKLAVVHNPKLILNIEHYQLLQEKSQNQNKNKKHL